MKTQNEQIKAASNAYIISLNDPKDGMATHRFSIYLQTGDEPLEVLWPVLEEERKSLLNHQVYSTRRTYPAYHFALNGCGYSKVQELRDMLAQINPKITVFTMTGCSPSKI